MRIRSWVSVITVGAVMGCGILDSGSSRRTLFIQHHRAECIGVAFNLCLLVREAGETEFTYRHAGIEGFAYEWGYLYEVRVQEQEISNPPLDGSSVRTILLDVETQERVAPETEFELFLTGGDGRVVAVGADRYRFYDSAEFVCLPGSDCAGLEAQISSGARIKYRFAHPAQPNDPLTLVEWEACDLALAGSNRCDA